MCVCVIRLKKCILIHKIHAGKSSINSSILERRQRQASSPAKPSCLQPLLHFLRVRAAIRARRTVHFTGDSGHNLEKLDFPKFLFQHCHLSTFNGFIKSTGHHGSCTISSGFPAKCSHKRNEIQESSSFSTNSYTTVFSRTKVLFHHFFQDVPHVSIFLPS